MPEAPAFDPLGFEVAYSCEFPGWLPLSSGDILPFKTSGRRLLDGLPVRVSPRGAGSPWGGSFEYGEGRLSGAYGTPSAGTVCVISRGAAYVVPTNEPEAYVAQTGAYVESVHALNDLGLLVLATGLDLIAISELGEAWRTRRLSWDGLRITQVGPDRIEGLARDPYENIEVPFSVDPATGEHAGGSVPRGFE